ncbi:MAG: hypothetical protein ACE5HQ_12120 [Gemmatimonadota bacterium]
MSSRPPQSVEVDDHGRLIVADRSRVISLFRRPSAGSRYEFLRSFRVDVTPESMCLLEDEIVVQGALAGVDGVVHRFTDTGRLLASFGRGFAGGNEIVNETMSWGLVACTVRPAAVLYQPFFRSHVEAFDAGGSAIWDASLPGYRQIRYEALPEGGARFVWVTPEGTHRAVSATSVGSGIVLVQVVLQDSSRRSLEDYRQIISLFFEVATGNVVARTDRLPVIRAAELPWFVSVAQLPYPTVNVWRLGEIGPTTR